MAALIIAVVTFPVSLTVAAAVTGTTSEAGRKASGFENSGTLAMPSRRGNKLLKDSITDGECLSKDSESFKVTKAADAQWILLLSVNRTAENCAGTECSIWDFSSGAQVGTLDAAEDQNYRAATTGGELAQMRLDRIKFTTKKSAGASGLNLECSSARLVLTLYGLEKPSACQGKQDLGVSIPGAGELFWNADNTCEGAAQIGVVLENGDNILNQVGVSSTDRIYLWGKYDWKKFNGVPLNQDKCEFEDMFCDQQFMVPNSQVQIPQATSSSIRKELCKQHCRELSGGAAAVAFFRLPPDINEGLCDCRTQWCWNHSYGEATQHATAPPHHTVLMQTKDPKLCKTPPQIVPLTECKWVNFKLCHEDKNCHLQGAGCPDGYFGRCSLDEKAQPASNVADGNNHTWAQWRSGLPEENLRMQCKFTPSVVASVSWITTGQISCDSNEAHPVVNAVHLGSMENTPSYTLTSTHKGTPNGTVGVGSVELYSYILVELSTVSACGGAIATMNEIAITTAPPTSSPTPSPTSLRRRR
jgi:hypothetical protein